jgi:hypothetical protein
MSICGEPRFKEETSEGPRALTARPSPTDGGDEDGCEKE